MSRRYLNGLARNLAEQFEVSCAHFAHQALQLGIDAVQIDVLAQTIAPAPLDIERNRALVRRLHDTVRGWQRGPLAAPLRAARIEARFSNQRHDAARGHPLADAALTATLEDDRGHAYRVQRDVQGVLPDA
jgi:hypothetical protein